MIKNYLLAIFLLATVLLKGQASTFTISAGTGTVVGSNISVPVGCTATFTATITSGAAGSWYWGASGGMSIASYYFATPTITFTNTGTYTLTTVATPTPPLSTISDTVFTIVNILALPSITPPAAICPGASASLNISPSMTGATYSWTPSGTLSSGTGASIMAFPTTTSDYTVTAINQYGCPSSTATVVVNVNAAPSVSASNVSVCSGSSATLTAVGSAMSYSWSTGASTSTVVVTPTSTQAYTVTGKSSAGCFAAATVTVTLDALPVISVTTTNPLCFGQCNGSATATVTGAGPFSTTSTGWTLTTNTASIYNICASTSYPLTISDGNNCVATHTLIEIAPSVISYILTNTVTTCGLANGAISASVAGGTPGYTYSWSPGNYTSANISNLAAGTYSLNIKDANGCTTYTDMVINSSSNTASITVNPASSSICAGSSLTLTATGNIITYTWTSGANTASVSVFPASSTIYTVTGTDANNCINSSIITVTVTNYNNLSGTIYDTTTVSGLHPITAGSVYLYTQQPGGTIGIDTTNLVVSTNTLTGAYTFSQVPPGNYYVKAVASVNTYTGSVATYLSTGPNAYLWSSATAISHSGCASGNDAGHNITIIELPAETGSGIISGVISYDATFGHRLNGNNQVYGAPLKGIDIKLGKNPGGGCVARTSVNGTGSTGTYTFTNLNAGSYSIYADIPNFGMTTILTVTISPSNLVSTNNNYCVDSVTVNTKCLQAAGINQVMNSGYQVNLYPNPNNGVFNIQMNEYENAQVEIYNVIGQRVYSHILQNNLEQINLGVLLTEGIYQVRVLKNSNTVYQTKLIKQ